MQFPLKGILRWLTVRNRLAFYKHRSAHLMRMEIDMKAFEAVGSWILDTKSGLVFGCLVLLGALAVGGYQYLVAPKTVILSSKEFTCVAAEPHGLATRCVEYRRVH